MFHTHTHPAHIPLHQFTHNSLAVIRHGEYQLSFHFDVQGMIFRVCSITPFAPYHCISLFSRWLSLSLSSSLTVGNRWRSSWGRQSTDTCLPVATVTDGHIWPRMGGEGWCGVCNGDGQLSAESWWEKTDLKLTHKSWHRKRAERSARPVPAHLSAQNSNSFGTDWTLLPAWLDFHEAALLANITEKMK